MKRKNVLIPLCLTAFVVLMLTVTSCGKQPQATTEEPRTEKTTVSKETSTAPEESSQPPQPTVETKNAEEFFSEHGTVLDVKNIDASDSMLSESEICELLKARGFTDYPITAGQDSEGNLIDEVKVSPDSQRKHPIYETFYASPQGILWVITVIGDTVMANPLSYNLESSKDVMVYISEHEYVTSFDNASKRFFNTVPSESVLILKQVERIDAATLDAMTREEIDR